MIWRNAESFRRSAMHTQTKQLQAFGEEVFSRFSSRAPALLVASDEVEYVLPVLREQYQRFFARYRKAYPLQGDSGAQHPRFWLWKMHKGLREVTLEGVDGQERMTCGPAVDRIPFLEGSPEINSQSLEHTLRYIHALLTDTDIMTAGADLFVIAHPKIALGSLPGTSLWLEDVLAEMNHNPGPVRIVLTGLVGQLPPHIANFIPALEFPHPDEISVRGVLAEAAGPNHPAYARPEEIPSSMAAALAGLSWRPLATTAREVAVRLSSPEQALAHATQAKVATLRTMAPFARLVPTVVEEPPLVGFDRARELAAELKLVLSKPELGVSAGGGIFLMGIPGNGKTQFVYWLSWYLGVPVIFDNFGDRANSLIGESEKADRALKRMAWAMGPHLYMLDEVEKQTPNLKGSASDGGWGARQVAAMLQFQQEAASAGKPIVFVATANTTHLDNLPPEFYSRYPNRYYVGEMSRETLAQVYQAHLSRLGGNEAYDCGALAGCLVEHMSRRVRDLTGKEVPATTVPVGRDIVQTIDAARRKAVVRDSSVPTQDELLAAIRELREGLLALDPQGIILARRVDEVSSNFPRPTGRRRSGDDGLITLNN
ncbi:MAG: ATP-binding protein [Proteobacteria bacterium]|nr:ATP-binding protein [Pseudomonadota bacterium]